MRIKRLLQCILGLLGCCVSSIGQEAWEGVPVDVDGEGTCVGMRSGGDGVPLVDVVAEEDNWEWDGEEKGLRTYRFARGVDVDIDVVRDGEKRVVGQKAVYRVGVRCKGAVSMGVAMDEIRLPEGWRMYVYGKGKEEIHGAYGAESVPRGGVFFCRAVEGEEAVVQIEVDADEAEAMEGMMKAHVFRANAGMRTLPSFGSSARCHNEAVCAREETGELMRGECLLLVNGTTYGSGTLVASADTGLAPYILTAAHVFYNGRGVVDTSLAKTCVVFFGYRSPGCGTKVMGTREMSVCGGRLVTWRKDRDMAVLRLEKMPPIDYMPLLEGWSLTDAPNGPNMCFHHPSGDVTKVSKYAKAVEKGTFTAEGVFKKDGHWMVPLWDSGITEGGSSGSGLIDGDGYLIGALSGGNPNISCSNPGYDSFWRLDVAWDDSEVEHENLKSVLDPKGEASVGYRCDAQEPYGKKRCERVGEREWGEDMEEIDYGTLGYGAGSNSVGITRFGQRIKMPGERSLVYGVSFYPICATYKGDEPIVMTVYETDEEGMPSDTLWSGAVRVTNTQYMKKTGEMQEKDVTAMGYKENYVRFGKALEAKGDIVVAFDIEGVRSNKFGLFHSVGGEEKGALYDDGKEWRSYRFHPFASDMGAIMVEAIAREMDEEDLGIRDIVAKDNVGIVMPNPAKEWVEIDEEDAVGVWAVDAMGRSIALKKEGKIIDVRGLECGVYGLMVNKRGGDVWIYKLIKE